MYKQRKRKGQAIVEFAMVFPFFLLVVVGGIIDFGFAFYNYQTLQQIANDTAQWAAESLKDETNASAITEYANSLRPSWWTGSFTVGTPTWVDLTTTGKIINVSVAYTSPAYTPFYQTMFSATTGNKGIQLSATASYKRLTTLKRY
jgi:Flp pilus assembly protein TadG